MVSFAEGYLFSALEGEAKFWITLYFTVIGTFNKDTKIPQNNWGNKMQIRYRNSFSPYEYINYYYR